ncbi:MAG: hypothetical protein PW788_04300 [Micavibrio sp.]|nr:hypothetical protein [Micavibrio sp.]
MNRHWSGIDLDRSYDAWLRREKAVILNADTASALLPYINHRNGFLREPAILQAAERRLVETLPHLVQRVNDWVPVISQAAMRAVLAFLAPEYFSAVAAALPDVDSLRRRTRRDHEVFIARVEGWLTAQEGFAASLQNLRTFPPKVARRLFALGLEKQSLPLATLIRLGLSARDLVTAQRAAAATADLPLADRTALAQAFSQGRSGWLRLAGLRLLMAVNDPAVPALAGRGLLDPHTGCREWCERRLALPLPELRAVRRAALVDNSAPPPRQLTALRLTGAGRDAAALPLVRPFLGHPRPLFRAAALLAAARLAPEEFAGAVKASLLDASPSIARAGAEAVRDLNMRFTVHEWQQLAGQVQTETAARRLLSLARLNKWDHLGFALMLYSHAAFKALSLASLRQWQLHFNRSALAPTAQQRAWIAEGLQHYDGMSPSGERLGFYLS